MMTFVQKGSWLFPYWGPLGLTSEKKLLWGQIYFYPLFVKNKLLSTKMETFVKTFNQRVKRCCKRVILMKNDLGHCGGNSWNDLKKCKTIKCQKIPKFFHCVILFKDNVLVFLPKDLQNSLLRDFPQIIFQTL